MKRLYRDKDARGLLAAYFGSLLQHMHRNNEDTKTISVENNPDKVFGMHDAIEVLFEKEFPNRFDWKCSRHHYNRYFQVYCAQC